MKILNVTPKFFVSRPHNSVLEPVIAGMPRILCVFIFKFYFILFIYLFYLKTQLYRFVRTSQETHYVSAPSPTG
jgi:hypothetical protein